MPVDIEEWMKEGRKSRFPNTGMLAHFSPASQMITLDAYTGDDLPKAMAANDHDRAREIMATMSHELTHWADTIGTLWGREHLERVYGLYDLMPRATEPDFPRFVELHDENRRLSFPQYYHTVREAVQSHDTKRPWRIHFSAGREIDPMGRMDETRPILFVNFSDHDTGDLLIRQPMTVGALLETTAVASESHASVHYILGKVPEAERMVAFHHAGQDLSSRLYAPSLTLYTAPVHMFARMSRLTDPMIAYDHASCLAHLCLNLNDQHFPGLLLPTGMADWEVLFPNFKCRRDRAFAFAVVCFNLEPWQSGFKLEAWLDDALAKSGLPKAEVIMADAIAAMTQQAADHQAAALNDAHGYMLELGLAVAKSRVNGPAFSIGHSMKALGLLPPMLDKEGHLIRFPGKKFDEARFAPIDVIDLDWALEGYIRNLLTGCR
ncbi:hypothetical protein ASG47_07195 [Devosia sp. Leaf420]|uniref:hypothetical protein n=1 Tax=Devosia sp. Leaf420 TaxID=1736374 RepID=UPI000713F473|nr:hypothetical protein [Devosia sp. Leaf420]KQT48152.1 hypothetical protein ASG47_07195 [Devosia sp. Leaf420]